MFEIGPRGVTVTLKNDEETIRQLLAVKSEDVPRITSGAIRYAVQGAPASVSRTLRGDLGFTAQASRLKKDVAVPRIARGQMSARVKLNRRPVTVMQFRGRQLNQRKSGRSRGVTYSVYRGQRRINPAGFVGRAKQGVQLPFYRKGGKLEVLYGPSLHGAFTGGEKEAQAKLKVGQDILDRLEVGVRRTIASIGGGWSR